MFQYPSPRCLVVEGKGKILSKTTRGLLTATQSIRIDETLKHQRLPAPLLPAALHPTSVAGHTTLSPPLRAQPRPNGASSSSAPPPPSSWVILGSIARVSAQADGSDVSLALTAAPRVSILTVSPRVFPEPATPKHFPFVLAADPSGLLLLQANLCCPETQETIHRRRNQSTFLKYWTSRYFVLDATASSAFQLPDPEPAYTIAHQALLGLIVSPSGDGHYMVAELQPIIGIEKATLLCFSSETGKWFDKRVDYPLLPRPWTPIGVVSHQGRLWWIDLSWGVINFDPFAKRPDLGLVPFPPGTMLECREGWGETDMYRSVGVSGGKLRFVDTYTRGGGTPKVTVWTLADPDSTEWTLEHEATFTEIWADKSYKATRMPKKIPVLALIHPKNPRIVYFFLEKNLFGVDVRTRKVVECKVYGLVAPPSCHIATRFVRAWELPQPLPSGMNNWGKGINLAEKAKGRLSQPSPGDYHLVGMTMQTFIG